MNTMKIIAEIKITCATLESEKKILMERVKELDDKLTGYRMAIESLEMTMTPKPSTAVSMPETAPVAEEKEPVAENPGEKLGCKTVIEYNGVSKKISDWAKDIGMAPQSLIYRMKRGWSIKDAIEQPKSPGITVIPRKPRAKAAHRVFKYDQMGNSIRQYMSVADAAADLRMSEITVQKIIEHVSKTDQLKAHNYYLAYAK